MAAQKVDEVIVKVPQGVKTVKIEFQQPTGIKPECLSNKKLKRIVD